MSRERCTQPEYGQNAEEADFELGTAGVGILKGKIDGDPEKNISFGGRLVGWEGGDVHERENDQSGDSKTKRKQVGDNYIWGSMASNCCYGLWSLTEELLVIVDPRSQREHNNIYNEQQG